LATLNTEVKVTDNSEMMNIDGMSVAQADAMLAKLGYEAPVEVALV